jgi:xanthine dehydrogenase YagR molybdenum-binding subunit
MNIDAKANLAVGKPFNRVDGRLKVTGAATFSAEYPLPGLLHAVLIQSTIARGTIRSVDAEAARKAPGVVAVYTHENSPKLIPTGALDFTKFDTSAGASSIVPLGGPEVYHVGHHVGLVVADTLERARHAAGLVRFTYAATQARTRPEGELPNARPPKNMMGAPPEQGRGDAEAALAAAEVKVDHTYSTPFQHHNPLEPHAITASWDGSKLTVYNASQHISGDKLHLAKTLGIPAADVRVISRFVGGGFGCKGLAWPHIALAGMASKHLGRPVKLSLTRSQLFTSNGYRSPTIQRVALGASRDGTLRALLHTGTTLTSEKDDFVEIFTIGTHHMYECRDVKTSQRLARLNVPLPTFMRAPGETPGMFALESAVDELAYALKMDPIALRIKNEPEKDPGDGRPFSSRSLLACYEQGAKRFGWDRRMPELRSMRDGRYLVGMGVACATYPVMQMPSSARVRLSVDGSALVQSGGQEMGMGLATIMTQLSADTLGLPMDRVRFELGDTEFPPASIAGGSMQTVSVGSAVRAACEKAIDAILELVAKDDSPLKGAKRDEVEAGLGGLYRKDDSTKGETYAEILKRHKKDSIDAEGSSMPPAEARKFSMHSYGAQFAEVRVDPDLGEVRLSRFLGAFGCGTIMNAKTARSQMIGGITMGVGMALMEETHLDPRSGKFVNDNIAEYLVPTHADIPAIDAFFVDERDPVSPLGAKGIGEIGITGVAAAVANAVYHATGRRVRDLPITPEKLL